MTLSIELEVRQSCVIPTYVVMSVNEAPAPHSSHNISHLLPYPPFSSASTLYNDPHPQSKKETNLQPTSKANQTKPPCRPNTTKTPSPPATPKTTPTSPTAHRTSPSRKTRRPSTTPLTPLLLILMSNWVSRLSHLPYLLSSLPSHLTPVPSVRTLGRKRVKKKKTNSCAKNATEKDDAEAIDKSNILRGSRTRGAGKPKGTYTEPGEEEGMPPPEDGTSNVR